MCVRRGVRQMWKMDGWCLCIRFSQDSDVLRFGNAHTPSRRCSLCVIKLHPGPDSLPWDIFIVRMKKIIFHHFCVLKWKHFQYESHRDTMRPFYLLFGIVQGVWNTRVQGTWVAQWLSVCLWLRAWSWGPGIEPPVGLPAGSLLHPLPVSLPLSVCFSCINK